MQCDPGESPAALGTVRSADELSPYIRTRSAVFQRTLTQMRALARSPSAPVLLEGESGTGKTMLAQRIHELSPRARFPFQTIHASAIDDSLASTALFGHTSGAFTGARGPRVGAFAAAQGGTLFVDEIGKASLLFQQRLLLAIETGDFQPVGSDRAIHVDVRIVMATNASLEQLVREGRFLPDLYARVQAYSIHIPALRERRADIPLLVENAVLRLSADAGYAKSPTISPNLMTAFQHAPWANNIRELITTLHRVLLDAEGADPLGTEHCRAFPELLGLAQRPAKLNGARVRAAQRTANIAEHRVQPGMRRVELIVRRVQSGVR